MSDVPLCEICKRNQATPHSTCRKTGKRFYKRTCNTCYRHRHKLPKLEPRRPVNKLSPEEQLAREQLLGPIQRPLCATCQRKPARYMGVGKSGLQHRYSHECYACQVARRRSPDYKPKWLTQEEHARRKALGVRNGNGRNRYRLHLKEKCERCGFIPEEYCQLVIHHLDENHSNNEPLNLQTLCHNCHNLIHFLSRKTTSR